jgi:hypothetical protein
MPGVRPIDAADIIRATAVMLDAALTKPKKVKKAEEDKLPFTMSVFYELLKAECSDHLNIDTTTNASFGRLGKTLKTISPAIEIQDLDKLVVWIQQGNLDWWSEPPTWNQLIRNIVNWIAKAREYDAPSEGGGSVVR